MNRKFDLFYNIPTWNKIFFAFFISLSCMLFFFFIAVLSAFIIFDLSLEEAKQYIVSGPDFNNIAVIKLFQIFQSIGAFLIPSFILAYIFHSNQWEYLKLNKRPAIISMILAILSIVVAIPVINHIAELNSRIDLPDFMGRLENKIIDLENDAGQIMESFFNTSTIRGLAVNILMISILPAIGEELLFRGIFQRLFIEWTKNVHLGIFAGAFIFSFIHLQFFGFLPRLLLGIYFGYLFIWSKTIWLPVIAHFVNNAFAVIYYHFSGSNFGESKIDYMGRVEGDFIYLAASISLLIVLVFSIYNVERLRTTNN